MVLLIDDFPEFIYFGLCQVFYPGFRGDACQRQYFITVIRADAVYILQGDPCLLIDRYVYSRYTWHISSLLTLPLLMLGILADNSHNPASFHDLAFFTSNFY